MRSGGFYAIIDHVTKGSVTTEDICTGGGTEMGIRGIDIQVAIQRAAEAEKIQQGETSQARAGEAGSREEAEMERTRRREQSQKPETSDQVIIQREKNKREGGRDEPDRSGRESDSEESMEAEVQSKGERLRKPIKGDRLDILA